MDQIELLAKIDYFELLSLAKVYGPYTRQDGRQIVVVKYNGRSRTVSYPKYLMEQHLGRELDPDLDTVDHIDSNFNNNDISNLRLMKRDEHSADDTRRVKLVKMNCSLCNKEFERSPRLMRDKSKKGVSGIFCSRQCAGKYSQLLKLKKIDKLPIQPYIESEYFKKKNVALFINLMMKKYS